MSTLLAKEAKLKQILGQYASMAIAYSGGVDSTYLAAVAHLVLGKQATMVLADSPSIPRSEVAEALQIAQSREWNLKTIKTQEFENEAYLKNDSRRCFYCKSELFQKMDAYAKRKSIKILAYGAIEDDKLDYRPGQKAANDYQVIAPLQEAGLFKEEIRQLSKRIKLPTWQKASFACLSSRIPKGTKITIATMNQVEQSEALLKELGFHQYRVRHHNELCRIEIDPADMEKFMQQREHIAEQLRGFGYRYVTLDLRGYRMGSTAV